MICPYCEKQMHQYKKIGGGVSDDDFYETWEIKKCDSCGRMVKEYYSVKVLYENDIKDLEDNKGNK